jgi:hypothetical protein
MMGGITMAKGIAMIVEITKSDRKPEEFGA